MKYVYVHFCPNGKVYVGITQQKPKKRWGSNGCNYSANKHFFAAIKKYGWENIKHVVYEVETIEEMYYLEKYLIAYYQSNDREYGYNNSIGGEKSGYGCHHLFTEEHKKKLSDCAKGRIFTEEHRKNLSISHKGQKPNSGCFKKGQTNPRKGHKLERQKWITPSGEIREMNVSHVYQHHPDWKLYIEE